MDEKSPFNLLGIFSLKCSVKEPSFCLKCESCELINKINCTKSWFRSLGYKNQKLFLEELIRYAPDLMNKLPAILYGLHSKDYQYAKLRLEPSVNNDGFQSNTNHSLDINEIQCSMVDYLSWFKSASEWTRSNYLLVLLQLCSTQLLDAIKEFVIKNTDKNVLSTYEVHQSEEKYSNNPESLLQNIMIRSKCFPKCNSAPPTRQNNGTGSQHFRNRINSARERVLFDDKIKFIDNVHKPGMNERNISHINSRVSSVSSFKLSQNSSRVQFCDQSNSSARCTPLVPSNSQSHIDLTDDMIIKTRNISVNTPISDTYFNNFNTKDLIKCLPVHLAKKIFGYLDERSLKVASCVNSLWNDLGKQVKAEIKYIQARKEDVMMMQSTGAKTPHPSYARNVPVVIPQLDIEGNAQINKEGKHIDVEIIIDEFADINMECCYDGLETRKVIMEERNVYCSSYNVLMLESRHDPNRHIHYDGGDFICIGSSDRKIHVINVNTGDRVKLIYGHSGSIKCLHLDEKNYTLISGSYDTTIRLWNLKNGKCKVIFLGHHGTVVCVAISKKLLVSAATDCNIKIWDLSTGKCNATLTHSSVVRVLNILGDQIITGSSNGDVITWDVKTCIISKRFMGHDDMVTCLRCNIYFIFTGSSDGFVKLWNNVGNLCTCLKTFRHPGDILCLDVSDCRLITGCFDGKIRVWNILNGNCLRVIRGNGRNDPISYLFASNDRLVVNTVSSILVYNFESVKWNYSAPREQGEISKTTINSASDEIRPYSYTRAQKLIYHGSPLHKADVKRVSDYQVVDDKEMIPTVINNMKIGENFATSKKMRRNRINRIKSAPTVSRVPYDNKNNTVNFGTKINRIKSAPSASKNLCSVDQHITRVKSATLIHTAGIGIHAFQEGNTVDSKQGYSRATGSIAIYDLKGTCIKENTTLLSGDKDYMKEVQRSSKPTVRARCRSAPVQRVINLPPNERGVSTSSFTFTENVSKKMILKTPNIRKVQRPKTATSSKSASLKDLKLRTFHSQLNFEEKLENNGHK